MQTLLTVAAVFVAFGVICGIAQASWDRFLCWMTPLKEPSEERFDIQLGLAFNELKSTHGDGLWEDEFLGHPLTDAQREQLTRWLQAATPLGIERYVAMRTRQRKV